MKNENQTRNKPPLLEQPAFHWHVMSHPAIQWWPRNKQHKYKNRQLCIGFVYDVFLASKPIARVNAKVQLREDSLESNGLRNYTEDFLRAISNRKVIPRNINNSFNLPAVVLNMKILNKNPNGLFFFSLGSSYSPLNQYTRNTPKNFRQGFNKLVEAREKKKKV